MKSIYTLCCILACIIAYAQPQADSAFVSKAAGNAIDIYTKAIGPQSHIYNGNAYAEYQQQKEEHPYFIDEWIDGTVVYENELYEKVPLLLDIRSNKLITDHMYNVHKLQLVNSKVSSFTLREHQFINLKEKNSPEAYYEVLYDGKTKVYALWKKTFQQTISGRTIENHFEDHTTFYVLKDGTMNAVKSKRSVFNVMADKKSELKKFLRSNHIRFKADRPKGISQMAAYYDQD